MRAKLFMIAAGLALGSGAAAAQTTRNSALTSRPDIEVVVNGTMIEFGKEAPVKASGQVFVPLHSILRSLPGFVLVWDPRDQSITGAYLDRSVRLRLGSKTATVNGSTVNMDVAATTVDGHVVVPLRFLSEALGAVVSYSLPDQRVTVTFPVANQPSIAVNETVPARRYFRAPQTRANTRGVKFTLASQQDVTPAASASSLEERAKATYNKWVDDKNAWMTDRGNAIAWSVRQNAYMSMPYYNGSYGVSGTPAFGALTGQASGSSLSVGVMPREPGGWAMWQSILNQDADQVAADQQQFNVDYAAYVRAFKRLHPDGTPLAKPPAP